MIYRKPDNVSYTQMCIEIDNTFYTDSRDDNKCFEYLFHVILMLARNNCLCSMQQEYEDFAIYAASVVFRRMDNSKEPVKSVLNYCKSTVQYLRVDFEYFEGRVQPNPDASEIETSYNFNHILSQRLSSLSVAEFHILLGDIPRFVSSFLKNTHYCDETVEKTNLHVSLLLTVLNRLTFSRKSRRRLDNLLQVNKLTTDKVNQMFYRERYDSVVLFHLPESMRGYVDVLARRLLHVVAQELSASLHTNIDNDWTSIGVAVHDFNRGNMDVNKD